MPVQRQRSWQGDATAEAQGELKCQSVNQPKEEDEIRKKQICSPLPENRVKIKDRKKWGLEQSNHQLTIVVDVEKLGARRSTWGMAIAHRAKALTLL